MFTLKIEKLVFTDIQITSFMEPDILKIIRIRNKYRNLCILYILFMPFCLYITCIYPSFAQIQKQYRTDKLREGVLGMAWRYSRPPWAGLSRGFVEKLISSPDAIANLEH